MDQPLRQGAQPRRKPLHACPRKTHASQGFVCPRCACRGKASAFARGVVSVTDSPAKGHAQAIPSTSPQIRSLLALHTVHAWVHVVALWSQAFICDSFGEDAWNKVGSDLQLCQQASSKLVSRSMRLLKRSQHPADTLLGPLLRQILEESGVKPMWVSSCPYPGEQALAVYATCSQPAKFLSACILWRLA